jgi:hypothetical protein
MRTAFIALTAATLFAAATLNLARFSGANPMTTAAPAATQSGAHDFDFIAGEWRARHRRLKERLAGSTEWIEFTGTQSARIIMGGTANMDDNVFDMPGGAYRGITLRAFDAASGLWSIWWLDSRYPQNPMDPPMRGRFENGVGLFYADETFNGRPIRVRFIWKNISPTQSRWEQAFSADGGQTWETNWTTDFTKTP